MTDTKALFPDADPDGPEAFSGTLMDGLDDEPGALLPDGFDTTVVMGCGDTFRVRKIEGLPPYKVGDWSACVHHSAIRAYNPATGEPDYARDQRVVWVQPDA